MSTTRLTRQVIRVCDAALAELPEGNFRSRIEYVRAKLVEPLRVAVAGSVSSGKSTLVNALLGQRIAAVDAGECTRLNTWFTYDHHERIVVVRRDGSRRTLNFERGYRIPDDLGIETAAIDRVVVHLSNDRLRRLTIIDTPGLNTVSEDNQAVAADLLGLAGAGGSAATTWGSVSKEATDSKGAMVAADALVFLMPHVRTTDVEVLQHFRNLFASSGLAAVNVVGVLSKIDKLTPDGDPWPTAHRLADRARAELGAIASDVIPVNGLLAETANTDRFTEDDADAIRQLAALDEMDLEDALLSQTDFLETDLLDVHRERRRRVLRMLDLHGIAVAVEHSRAGASSAHALLAKLREQSGFAPLERVIDDLFGRRADALKAHAGLADLRRLAYVHGDNLPDDERQYLWSLRGPLERIELDPGFHDLRVFDALRRADEGSVSLTPEMAADLRRLALELSPPRRMGLPDSADPAQVASASAERVRAWTAYGNDPRRSPDERRMADDIREAYELLWDQAQGKP
jgi:hypothetical protein